MDKVAYELIILALFVGASYWIVLQRVYHLEQRIRFLEREADGE